MINKLLNVGLNVLVDSLCVAMHDRLHVPHFLWLMTNGKYTTVATIIFTHRSITTTVEQTPMI